MKTLVFVLATSLLAALPAFADLHVTLKEGRVSIVATDVTVRQILTEWMRVGQIKIVNLERIPGGPVTLELDDVSETQALDVLLRSLSGYIAAPRAVAAANLSNFDRIIVMPTLAAARTAVTASSTPPPRAQPQELQPVATTPEPVETAQYEEPPPPDEPIPMPTAVAMAPGDMNRNSVSAARHSQETMRPGVLPNGIVPQMPTNLPQAFPPSAAAPVGAVARPGMLVPAPPPGQPPRR